MRQRLCDVLQDLWDQAIGERRKLAPQSAVALLNLNPNLRLCSRATSPLTCRDGGGSPRNVFIKIGGIRYPLWHTGLVKRASGSMHIDDTSRQYFTTAGERRITRCLLLRRSYRDENGKPRNETLANLSALPDSAISALRLALKGAALVDAESAFTVERSGWSQPVEAIGLRLSPGLSARRSSANTSAGVLNPSIARGRSFISLATA